MNLLFKFQVAGPRPTLESVMDQFGFRPEEVDHAYGVVQIDAQTASYVIRVDGSARKRLPESPGTGFFSDAAIGTFGPQHLGE
jgi:hypothetical protein